jgi:hypothetical protein
MFFATLLDCCLFSASDLNKELSDDSFYSLKLSNSWFNNLSGDVV